jgi:Tfp pilus assembly PilM family ATPase
VDDLASAEIARSAKLDAGTYEAACWDVPVARAGAGTGTSVLAVALRHEDAEAVIAPFDRVGLKVRAIEPVSCALARGMTYLSKQGNSGADAEKSIVALLDLGWRAGTVNLISDGQVLYQRALFDCGVGPLYRQLSEKHGIDDEAADVVLCDAGAPEAAGAVVSSLVQGFVAQVAEEVSASLAFARHRYSGRTVRQVMLTGGGAKIRGLAQGMAGAIELSVEVLGAHGQSDGVTANGEPAQLALATGLALHREEA